MLVLFVYFMSTCLLIMKAEVNLIKIGLKGDGNRLCNVLSEHTLEEGTNFTVDVNSEHFIKKSYWKHGPSSHKRYAPLPCLKLHIDYEKSENSSSITYAFSHMDIVTLDMEGIWRFKFEVLNNYDQWLTRDNIHNAQNWTCSTSVYIVHANKNYEKSSMYTAAPSELKIKDNKTDWPIILGPICGIILLAQTAYIVYSKTRGCATKRNNDEDTERNIANRPPLPLPSDVIIHEEPKLPISSGRKRDRHFPTAPPMPAQNTYENNRGVVPKHSYRNKGLDTSEEKVKSPPFSRRPTEDHLSSAPSYSNKALKTSKEEVRSPNFARRQLQDHLSPTPSYSNKALNTLDEEVRTPNFARRQLQDHLSPTPSYSNKALHTSDEEVRSPNFARRQLQAMLVQLPPHKGVFVSQHFKDPKPSPRPTLKPAVKSPAFHRAHRQESPPTLAPKKIPRPVPSEPQEQHRLSDDDWQYEQLQPSNKYM